MDKEAIYMSLVGSISILRHIYAVAKNLTHYKEWSSLYVLIEKDFSDAVLKKMNKIKSQNSMYSLSALDNVKKPKATEAANLNYVSVHYI